MAENWQDATSQQVKLIAGRLNELLSTGLDLLHSELGVDFGVKPEIPPWLIFLAASIGLVLMVAMWASACRGLFKKRPTILEVYETIENTKPSQIKAARTEEQKKKKRKPTEKKAQLNGRAVVDLQDEVRMTEEDNLPVLPHHSPQVKTEKASEVKKTRKKQKLAVKEAKTGSSPGKESEEVSGTWETKVSNKEKREQRRKDKTTGDGSGSPGGVGPLPSTPPTELSKDSPKAAAPVPGSGSEKREKKKKKGESSKAKAEKADVVAAVAVVTAQDNSSEEAPVVTGERNDRAVTPQESPALTIVPDQEHCNAPECNQDTAVWGQETEGDDGWIVIDAGITGMKAKDQNRVSSTRLGVGTAYGGGSAAAVDGVSDWNAPEALLGNCQNPAPEEAAPPALEKPLPEPVNTFQQVSDEERERVEPAADGTGKSKKKKKKKKQAEDSVLTGQESEGPSKKIVTESKVKKQPIQEPSKKIVTEAKVKKQPIQEPSKKVVTEAKVKKQPIQEPSKKVVTEAKVKKQPIQEPAVPSVQAVNTAAVKARVEQPVVVQNITPITQVSPQPAETEPTAKQNSLPAPTQKKPEESQPSKPVMKKKRARRET